ncbi:hypothetical protein GCM10023142_25860 [Anaerocolumna aminovalerica]|uniref:DnaJ domain-containing protein n=1 Tax=Anaerocolumna aminovalerica TaxID=1527 RepID=A0A1I5I8F8_9FIRM|nr:hypothetical protein [Anaerocolumna aminovalerica]MBU5334157.1 hypothetical protein [Anaerocolumna aminovalerica]SFO56948.1 hypothetical protein SAMN04489757_1416 [Anaerocolumna aminovalerica]
MYCHIEELHNIPTNTLGEPKKILVDSYTWSNNGQTGKTYTYRMSNERYERPINKAYSISLCKDETYSLCVIHYYDLVDYDLEDCIGESKIDSITKQTNISSDEIWSIIKSEVRPLQERILNEYQQTEEYLARKHHQEVLKEYRRAKEDFQKEYGIAASEYDRCYNVFGELMNSEYLNQLNQILEERINLKKNSKKYRKYAYQENFNNYYNSSSNSSEFNDDEREMLGKFYKILAKKYHPDSNPDMDTTSEILLINKLKKSWRV